MSTGYPSIDKPWLKYYEKGVEKAPIPELSIYQLIKHSNAKRLDKIALDLRNSSNDYKKGIEITYGQFFSRIEDIAKSYSQLGVKENQIVITLLPNIPESRMLIYGLNILGATPYPVSPMIAAPQLRKIISECNAKHLAIFAGFYEKFSSVISGAGLDSVLYLTGMESAPKPLQMLGKIKMGGSKPSLSGNILLWAEFDKFKKNVMHDIKPYYHPDHVAVIVGTSGTTGVPKGVCLTDRAMNAIAIQHLLSGILDEEEVVLDALIQSIAYGISTMHYSTYCGCKNILIPELLTTRFPEVLCRTKPDHFTGGPVHCQYLAVSEQFKNHNLPKLRNLVSGGATLPKDLEKRLNGVGEGFSENGSKDPHILVRQGFGATENGGCGAYARPGAYKFGGVGIPLPLDTFAVFEPGTDKELPYNTEGELCICGPTIMKEYFNNPSETQLVLKKHHDGQTWLHLADLGTMDEDGQVYITDRIKNIFMRTGFNVHPSKIAKFIETVPGVKECTVIGVPHPEEQMVPVAFVILDRSVFAENATAKETLSKACANNLSESDIPLNWVFVDEFPRNLGGKIDSKLLVQMSGVNYAETARDGDIEA